MVRATVHIEEAAQPLVLDVVRARPVARVAAPFRARFISLSIGVPNSRDGSRVNSRVIDPEKVVTVHVPARLVSEEGEGGMSAVLASFAHLVS